MTTSTSIEFVDQLPAPAHGRGGTGWGKSEAAQLRARPNAFAIIDRVPNDPEHRAEAAKLGARAGTIKRGKTSPWIDQAGRFEAATRTVEGEVRLYARYIPRLSEAA